MVILALRVKGAEMHMVIFALRVEGAEMERTTHAWILQHGQLTGAGSGFEDVL